AGEYEPAGREHTGDEEVPAPLVHLVRDAAPGDHADAAADIRDHCKPADLHVGEIAERLDDLRDEIEHAEAGRDDAEVVHRQKQHLGVYHRLPEILFGNATPDQ